MKKVLLAALLFLLAVAVQAQPAERTVRGVVYQADGINQAESGLPVIINNTNTSLVVLTQTYGPGPMPGIYSATIASQTGHLIRVFSFNDTRWGENYGFMEQTRVTIDLNLSNQRDSEAIVSILSPPNNTDYNSEDFNLSVQITIVGADGTACNATISFSNPGIIGLDSGESLTHSYGSIARGTSFTDVWNLTTLGTGTTNMTISAGCASDGYSILGRNSDTLYNITNIDTAGPLITVYSPANHSRITNPAVFLYNVTDGSDVLSCNLTLNSVVVNSTVPTEGYILNFTYNLMQKNNLWQLNCTDEFGNMGSTGIYNLTLNSRPGITTVVTDPINLLAASNRTVYCNGTLEDGDGFADIDYVNASLYADGYPDEPDDLLLRYSNSSCSIFNQAGDNADFSCSFDLIYFAENGTWWCNATAFDLVNATNSSLVQTTVNQLLAIGVTPNIINFGNLEILQISPNDVIINVTNYGNQELDLEAYSYAGIIDDNISMLCGQGNISFTDQRVSLLPGQAFATMTPMQNSLSPLQLDFNLGRQDSETLSIDQLFWKLQIPFRTFGVCNGKVVLTAVPG